MAIVGYCWVDQETANPLWQAGLASCMIPLFTLPHLTTPGLGGLGGLPQGALLKRNTEWKIPRRPAGRWKTKGVQGMLQLMSFDGECEEADAYRLQPQGEVESGCVRLSAGQRMGRRRMRGSSGGTGGLLAGHVMMG